MERALGMVLTGGEVEFGVVPLRVQRIALRRPGRPNRQIASTRPKIAKPFMANAPNACGRFSTPGTLAPRRLAGGQTTSALRGNRSSDGWQKFKQNA